MSFNSQYRFHIEFSVAPSLQPVMLFKFTYHIMSSVETPSRISPISHIDRIHDKMLFTHLLSKFCNVGPLPSSMLPCQQISIRI